MVPTSRSAVKNVANIDAGAVGNVIEVDRINESPSTLGFHVSDERLCRKVGLTARRSRNARAVFHTHFPGCGRAGLIRCLVTVDAEYRHAIAHDAAPTVELRHRAKGYLVDGRRAARVVRSGSVVNDGAIGGDAQRGDRL